MTEQKQQIKIIAVIGDDIKLNSNEIKITQNPNITITNIVVIEHNSKSQTLIGNAKEFCEISHQKYNVCYQKESRDIVLEESDVILAINDTIDESKNKKQIKTLTNKQKKKADNFLNLLKSMNIDQLGIMCENNIVKANVEEFLNQFDIQWKNQLNSTLKTRRKHFSKFYLETPTPTPCIEEEPDSEYTPSNEPLKSKTKEEISSAETSTSPDLTILAQNKVYKEMNKYKTKIEKEIVRKTPLVDINLHKWPKELKNIKIINDQIKCCVELHKFNTKIILQMIITKNKLPNINVINFSEKVRPDTPANVIKRLSLTPTAQIFKYNAIDDTEWIKSFPEIDKQLNNKQLKQKQQKIQININNNNKSDTINEKKRKEENKNNNNNTDFKRKKLNNQTIQITK